VTLFWRWEQTPLEAWRGFTFWVPPPVEIRLEVSKFRSEKQALDGAPGLHFQLGVSDKSVTRDINETRVEQPDLPPSGDRRSGVIALDGDCIVGGYIIDGTFHLQSHRIVVHPDYRGRRLSALMVLEWYKRVKRPETVAPQKMNPYGVRAFLSAQNAVYDWAVRSGKQVPDKVLYEMKTGDETSMILSLLAEVERTGRAVVLT
jgi:hypothetical protein